MPKIRRRITLELWNEIRHKWEHGAKSSDLIRTYDIPSATFYKRLHKEGWVQHVSDAMIQAITEAAKDPSPLNLSRAVEAVDDRRRADVMALARPGLAPAPAGPEAQRLQESAAATLRLADTTLKRVRDLLASKQLHDEALPLKDRTKAVLDLVNVLERLQKIERTALGMDAGQQAGNVNVVIMVPGKMDEDQWTRRVAGEVHED